ncbi:hypothetical protein FPZ41_03180 [Streptomyces sp. K1PN6]|uniref:Uncharacterized protein n=1 Tax=Streptomyces acidicola TaxID=2596892 RepID=A0A5N8WK99_9ACTN|nr:hypothetical protein [Streptomyces acidicola]
MQRSAFPTRQSLALDDPGSLRGRFDRRGWWRALVDGGKGTAERDELGRRVIPRAALAAYAPARHGGRPGAARRTGGSGPCSSCSSPCRSGPTSSCRFGAPCCSHDLGSVRHSKHS